MLEFNYTHRSRGSRGWKLRASSWTSVLKSIVISPLKNFILGGRGSCRAVFLGACGSDFGELSRVAGASPSLFQRAVIPYGIRAAILAGLVVVFLCREAGAQDTWNVVGGGDWNTAGNWDTVSVPNAIDAIAIIPAGFPNADATINISSGVVVGSIQLDNNFTSSLTGSDITFDITAGVGTLLFNTGSWTIENNLILIDPLNITTTADGILNGVISGTESLQKLAAGTLILSGANTYSGGTTISDGVLQGTTTSLQGNIDNGTSLVFDQTTTGTFSGVISSIGTVTKQNTGTVILTGANSYTGDTIINGGVLSIGANIHLGNLGNGLVFGGGTLQTSTGLTISRAVTLNAGGGTIDSNGNNPIFAGVISGIGAFTKIGAGTLVLSGINTYSGGTTISAGALQGTTTSLQGDITNNASLIFDQTTTGTYSGVISGTGSVTKQNTGIVTLSGINTYIGDTIINGGVLSIGANNNLGDAANGITFGGGTLFTTAGISTARDVTLNAGGGTIDTNGFDSTFSGVFSGTGALTKSSTGTLTLSGTNTYSGGTNVSAGVLQGTTSSLQGDIANNAIVIFDQTTTGTYSGVMSGAGSLFKNGTGTVILSGANTYNGGTTISAGALQGTTTSLQGDITNNASLIFDQTTSGTYSGVISGTGLVTKQNTGTVTLSGTNTYTGDTILNGGALSIGANNNLGDASNGLIFGGGTLQTSAGLTILRAATLNAGGGTVDTNGFDSTFSGIFSGTGALTKIGAGTLTLSGTNTYTGDTNINGGVLSVGANSNLGDAANVLAFGGGTLQTSTGLTISRATNLNAGGGTVDTNGFNSTFSGIISGTGDLTKIGAGTLTLSGINTYTGNTNINVGTISVGADSNLGDAANGLTFDGGTLFTTAGITSARATTLNAGGGIVDTNGFDSTFSGIIDGTGDLTKIGTGTLTLSGTNIYSGGTTVSAGTLLGTTSSLQGDITNNAILVFDQTVTGTYSGVISGTGTVVKQNTGTVIFSGDNIYSGGTFVFAGVLEGTTSSLQGDIINDASVIFDQAITGTYSGVMSGTGSLTKKGTGTAILSGTNTYSGGTTISAGALQGTTTSLQGDITNNSNLIFDQTTTGTYSGVISGTGSVTKQNTGTVTLSGTNTYTGDTNINGGVVSVGDNANLGDAANGLTFDGGTLFTTAGITSARVTTLNAGGGTIDTNGFNSTFSGIISGAGALTKTGTGTLTLSGINIYTGDTNINGGVVSVGANTNLGDAANGLTFDNGTLFTTAGITSARATTLNAGGGTVDTNGFDSTFSGIISGAGPLTKTGLGTLTLSGINTYTGNTVISGGIFQLGVANSMPSGTNVQISSGAVFEMNNIDATIGGLSGAGNVQLGTASLTAGATADTLLSGVISGTGSLTKDGTGTLTLSGNNTYSGGTTVSAGTLQGTTSSLQRDIVNNSSLTFDQSFAGTYTDVISGTGSLTKNGIGSVILSGVHTYSGVTTINGGRLTVNGSITNNTTVNNGGTLGGIGTVTGIVTVNTGGTMAPGNSIGTLTILGDYSQGVGSFLEIEIQSASNPTSPGVDNDLVDVTGNVTLSGGTVDVKAAAGTYKPDTEYTFLQYSGSLNGLFQGITDDLAFLDARLIYNTGNVSFIIEGLGSPVDFTTAAVTHNQFVVANYLNRIYPGTTGDLKSSLDELLLLTNGEAQHAYDLMSGDFQGSIAHIGIQNTSQIHSLLSRHLRPGMFGNPDSLLSVQQPALPKSSIQSAHFETENFPLVIRAQDDSSSSSLKSGVWTASYASIGQVTSESRYDYSTAGGMFGVEEFLDEGIRIGMFGSFGREEIRNSQLSRSVDVDNFLGGLYVSEEDGINYRLFNLAVGFDTYESTRHIEFGALNRTAQGDYNGWQGSAYLERGLTINKGNKSFQTYVALQYIHLQQQSFTESGAGTLNLLIDNVETNSLRTLLGGRFAWQVSTKFDCVSVIPEVRVAWGHEFLDSMTEVDARFNTTGGPGFLVRGAEFGSNWALLGTGLELRILDRVNLFGDYDAIINSQRFSHTGSGGLELIW